METPEKTPRQLLALKREGSPEEGRPDITVSLNIPESASEEQAAMIYRIFKKHFPAPAI